MLDHHDRETQMHEETTTSVEEPTFAAPEQPDHIEETAHHAEELAPTAAEEQARIEAEAPLSDEHVAHVESQSAHDRAELAAEGARWGKVDEEGNVRLHGTSEEGAEPGRIVGKMKGKSPEAALASFALKFRQITQRVEDLEREMEAHEDKTRFAGRVRTLLGWVPKANALGDFDSLLARLNTLDETARAQMKENLRRKEEVVVRMEELAESSEWKQTAEVIKRLQAEWKTLGPVPRERNDELWQRFRGAGNRFFERRKEHYETQEQEHRENLLRKEEICVRAEELSESTEWKSTGDALKGLQAEWKAVGPVPKEHNEAVWDRFRKANDAFFERRQAHFSQVDTDLQENLRRKEELCARAEELGESTDWRATAEAFKVLQAEWKAIGPVPKEQNEGIWERFRGAADRFFTRRKTHYDQLEKEQKENLRRKVALCEQAETLSASEEFKTTTEALKVLQAEWKAVGPVPRARAEALWDRFRKANDAFFERRAAWFAERDQDRSKNKGDWQDRLREALDRKKDQADRLRESIRYDEDTAERWRTRLTEIRPGAREQEIRQDTETRLADMEVKLGTKRGRLQELEEDIRSIEAKM
ncbi:MAG: hypothetical protein QOH06_5353 [Acidobacteriota bacterium]|jgi:uncharacterized protein (DUF2384 family)|nr:hypothetical protein [Acidobacteriota bacterium]